MCYNAGSWRLCVPRCHFSDQCSGACACHRIKGAMISAFGPAVHCLAALTLTPVVICRPCWQSLSAESSVELSRIRSKFPSKHFSLQRWRSVTPVVVTSNFWCRQSLSLKIPVLIWWLTRRFCVEFKVGCLLGTPARLVVHGQKRFSSRAVAENDDQSVREVSQVPSVVALCPRNSVGGDVATSSVETSPDRWRPMIRCQAMASRQNSVKGSRLGRIGCKRCLRRLPIQSLKRKQVTVNWKKRGCGR